MNEKNSFNYAAANSEYMEMIRTVVGIVEAHKLLKLFIRLWERQMKNWDDDNDDDDDRRPTTTQRKKNMHVERHARTRTQRQIERHIERI